MNHSPPEEFDRIVRGLRMRDPIRGIAVKFVQGRQPAASEIPLLIHEIRAPSAARWRQLHVALWAADRGALPAGPERRLVLPLCEIVEGRRPEDVRAVAVRWTMRLSVLVAALIGSVLSLCGVATTAPQVTDWLGKGLVLGISILMAFCAILILALITLTPFLIPISSAAERRRLLPSRVLAARVLRRLEDIRAIGSLATAGRSRSHDLSDAARNGLRRTLPRIRPSHLGSVPILDLVSLCSLAAKLHRTDEDLALAILDCLELVGTGAILLWVRRLQWNPISGVFLRRASEVAIVLEARLRREWDGSVLLRSSESPAHASVTLLRTARGAGESSANDLLMPTYNRDAA